MSKSLGEFQILRNEKIQKYRGETFSLWKKDEVSHKISLYSISLLDGELSIIFHTLMNKNLRQ